MLTGRPLADLSLNSLSPEVTVQTFDDTTHLQCDEDLDTILDESRSDDMDAEFSPTFDDDEAPSVRKKTRVTLPVWLSEHYGDVCAELNALKAKGKPPSCYDNGCFVLPMKLPIFQLKNVVQLEPSMFYRPEFFIWFPHLLLSNGIPCPACRAAGRRRKSDGQEVLLRLHSLPQAPRRIVDLQYNTYVIGQRYHCGHDDCGKSYLSWSTAIMDVLPPVVKSQFPFFLTRRCGVSNRVLELLRHCFQRGVGPLPFSNLLRKLHLTLFEERHWLYLAMVEH